MHEVARAMIPNDDGRLAYLGVLSVYVRSMWTRLALIGPVHDVNMYTCT
jgi:hypothetical protein